eukprot:g14774.t1
MRIATTGDGQRVRPKTTYRRPIVFFSHGLPEEQVTKLQEKGLSDTFSKDAEFIEKELEETKEGAKNARRVLQEGQARSHGADHKAGGGVSRLGWNRREAAADEAAPGAKGWCSGVPWRSTASTSTATAR